MQIIFDDMQNQQLKNQLTWRTRKPGKAAEFLASLMPPDAEEARVE